MVDVQLECVQLQGQALAYDVECLGPVGPHATNMPLLTPCLAQACAMCALCALVIWLPNLSGVLMGHGGVFMLGLGMVYHPQ